MKNIIKKYAGVLFLLVATSIFLTIETSYASSAKVDLTSDSSEVVIGEKINIYIKIDSEITFGDFEANLVYDETILEYKSGASVITGGQGLLRILDQGVAQGTSSRKYALEFEALKVGETKLAFSDRVMVYDESSNEMPVSNDELTIKVKAQDTASSEGYLETLITSPTNITPTFDKNIFEYSVNVDNQTEKLIISAIPQDDKAIVSIKGNDSLKDGENKVIVSVLAESGDIIEYTINVYREVASDTPGQTDQVTTTPVPLDDTSFKVIESNGDKYILLGGKYKLIEPEVDVVIPEGFIKNSLTLEGVTITSYVFSSESTSDFVLVYAENSLGEKSFYQYDTKENTLQRYLADKNLLADNSEDAYKSNINLAAVIIAILGAICALSIAVNIWLYLRIKQYKRDDIE